MRVQRVPRAIAVRPHQITMMHKGKEKGGATLIGHVLTTRTGLRYDRLEVQEDHDCMVPRQTDHVTATAGVTDAKESQWQRIRRVCFELAWLRLRMRLSDWTMFVFARRRSVELGQDNGI